MDVIADEHIRLFKKHAILLCGAGISVKSGIPSVIPFTQHLFRKLKASEADLQTFLDSGFPFEAMMEVLKTRLDIFELLSVFDKINVNANHQLIACMAKRGWLRMIITTNFDRNIEAALREVGLSEQQDFVVLHDLRLMKKFLLKKKILVLKIHGSIEDHPSILSTITGVANLANRQRMTQFLDRLFSSGQFDEVITWGYSFSDHFDIKPAIREMSPTTKRIYSVRYQSGILPEKILDNSNDELFRNFLAATNWFCSLDKIVKSAARSMGIRLKSVKKLPWKKMMSGTLSKEITGHGLKNANGILAALFQTAGHTDIAKKYAEKELAKCTTRSKDRLLRMDLLASVGKAYLRDPNNRDPNTALKYLEEARDVASRLQLSDYTRIYNADIGSCYLMLERYAEVEAPYLEAIIYYKGLMSDPYSRGMAVDRVTGYQTMLAHSFAKLKNYRNALALYKKTLKLCEKEGLLANQELCLAGYGLAYGLSNQPEKALPLFIEGYRLAVLNGSADRIKSQFYLTCSWMWSAKGEAEALKFYTKEYDFVHEKTGMDKSLKAIGPGLTGSLK